MKIVTRESSPSDSETIKATSTVISLPVFDSNGQIKAMYIYIANNIFGKWTFFWFLSPILLFFPCFFPCYPRFFPCFSPETFPVTGKTCKLTLLFCIFANRKAALVCTIFASSKKTNAMSENLFTLHGYGV